MFANLKRLFCLAIIVHGTAFADFCLISVDSGIDISSDEVEVTSQGTFINKTGKLYFLPLNDNELKKVGNADISGTFKVIELNDSVYIRDIDYIKVPNKEDPNKIDEKIATRFRKFDADTMTLNGKLESNQVHQWIYDVYKNILLEVYLSGLENKLSENSKLLTSGSDADVYRANIHELKGMYLVEFTGSPDTSNDKNTGNHLFVQFTDKKELLPVSEWKSGSINDVVQNEKEGEILTITQWSQIKEDQKRDGHIKRIPYDRSKETPLLSYDVGASENYRKIFKTENAIFVSYRDKNFSKDKLFQYNGNDVTEYSSTASQDLGEIRKVYEFKNDFLIASSKGLYYDPHKNNESLLKIKVDKNFGSSNTILQAENSSVFAISNDEDSFLYKFNPEQVNPKQGILYELRGWANNQWNKYINDINQKAENKPYSIINFPDSIKPKNLYRTSQGVLITTNRELYLSDAHDNLIPIKLKNNNKSNVVVEDVKTENLENNKDNGLIMTKSEQGFFQVIPCLSGDKRTAIKSILATFAYCIFVAIAARYHRFAFYWLANAPSILCFWSRYLLVKCPRYRQWIFQRYLEEKQKEFSTDDSVQSNFREKATEFLLDFRVENTSKLQKLWVCEEIEQNIYSAVNNMKKVYFSKENVRQCISEYRYIPIFISMAPKKIKGNINDTNFLLEVVKNELQINHANFLKQLLSCIDFVLILYPLYVPQHYAVQQFFEKVPKARMMVFSPNNSIPTWEQRRINPPPTDIFISHSSKDINITNKLGSILLEKGWSVWWDQENLRSGDEFPTVIDKEVSTARCVIVLVSYESLTSKWVELEVDKAEKRKTLLPIKIQEPKTPEHRVLFEKYTERYHMRDFTSWHFELDHDELIKLIDDITDLLAH